mmetsp:Transcript_1510/g.3203  ORF Transcript_1510/g.3203 Transcript_1510/m.3203 type:complete len:678 (-) Transcript_1510:202-2235(-)|eukprot:CAMPEP_0172320244 /NCGR_PEP_ID=MMETSP1058-20130122/40054_1 /TAXON_ID=83371 /ORGANISM="Detonula confervacea, Strain CCMP 353" /LENGTH=677 /DNA_ID=CAMNT_0013035467 /DNA_START=133 /DNA_END=2166 /DNA_ORIENTATION=+
MTMNSELSEPSPQQPTPTDSASHSVGVVDDVRIPLNDHAPRPSPPPFSLPHHSPSLLPLLARRTISAMGRDNNNNIVSPRALLKRRAFSYDAPRGGDGDAPSSSLGGDSAGVAASGNSSNMELDSDMLMLRTISSQVEMDDDDDYDGDGDQRSYMDENNNNNNNNAMDAHLRRRTLFSTPSRLRGDGHRQLVHHDQDQKDGHRNRNRAASSSDIVLNIHNNDCLLPRYDDDLACHIASIPNAVDQEEQLQQRQRRGASFTTPKRQISRPMAFNNRDRANTCPQRHSIFQLEQQQQQGMVCVGDEESGHQQLDDQHSDLEMEGVSLSPRWIAQNNLNRVSARKFTPEQSNNTTDTMALSSSPGIRRHTSPAVRRTPPAGPIPPFSTPSSARRTLSSTTPIVGVANTPQIPNTRLSPNSSGSRGIPSSGHPPATPASANPLTVTQQAHNQAQNVLLRLNPHVMKLLMILSLYMLLAYTWNTDYQFRYKSMEINYGLSEYWHTGGSLVSQHRAEKIGRDVPGKLFNDDGDVGGIAKLINGLVDDKLSGDDKLLLDDASSSSGDSALEDDVSSSSVILSSIDKQMKRRPAMSHARSILTDTSHPAYAIQRRAMSTRKPPSSKKWTISKLAWALVWMGFMIPIVEAGIREVRRQINFRFWNVRRLRSFRAMPTSRVVNVHNL